MNKFKIGIAGATGYTGIELVRLLVHHPEVTLQFATSETHAGKKLSEVHPHLLDTTDITLTSIADIASFDPDLVFLALPHGESMRFVEEQGIDAFITIDLSGDFRLGEAALYEEWYKKAHTASEYLKRAVYGLPELFRHQIRNARLIANPGCYPTSAILALAPLVKHGYIDPASVIIDSKSGVTGAGAKAKPGTHFPHLFGNFSAYSLVNHRHTPEIEIILNQQSERTSQVLFTPHLLPIDRGILTTTYSKPVKEISDEMLTDLFHATYEKENFVRILEQPPSVKHVRGSNYCDIFTRFDKRTRQIITVSVIDNLMKGAAGQAVQNMNIAFGLIESTGLRAIPLNP